MRDLVKQEAAHQMAETARTVLDRAQGSQDTADRLLGVITWVSTGWLAIVTILFAGILALGWIERRLINAAKDQTDAAAADARASANRVKEAEGEVTLAAQRVRAIDHAIAQAIADLRMYFDRLPTLELERLGLVGEPPDLPPPEQLARFEEADTLIVIAEQTKAVPSDTLVEPFVRLALYWRLVENYPRALARFHKAIELNPNSVEAHVGIGRTLYATAVQDGIGPSQKERLLTAAENEARYVLELTGQADSRAWFDLGWIYDERGKYQESVGYYLKAQALDVGGARPNITYNLACAYSRWGHQEEALAEISKVIAVDENWDDAAKDPDLEGLRQHEQFGPRLQALIDEQRRQSG